MRKLCPGQDTRFWRPEDIFEIPCGECGVPMEFFKDDVYRRCRQCGKKIENPKFNLGCAKWCEHARDCLGYDPELMDLEGEAGETLVDGVIDAVKAEFGGNQGRVTHALRALEYGREILRSEEGDPRIVLIALLVHDIGSRDAERILEETGVHRATAEDVCRIVEGLHGPEDPDTPESRIVSDADRLVNLVEGKDGPEAGEVESFLEERFKTEAGTSIARRELERRG